MKSILAFFVKILLTGFLLLMLSCTERPGSYQPADFPDEIIYHVFQRSFYDSNGDGIGDLNGLKEKLDYLQELGVTSVLMLPLYNSVFYHNYFPIDFETIDPEYGIKEDYFNLVREIHRRGMKIYMDMEVQYITEDHLWYKDSYKNPSSKYSDYLIYNGPGNTQPEPIVWGLTELLSYDGTVKKVTTLNLLGEKYQNYIHDLFKYWVDPNRDGNFEDGVDGFRIDHMMSDLDWKGKITGLFSALWKPLFDELRTINPEIKIMGEQANWGTDYGQEYYKQGGIDLVFAFGLNFAIRSFNKREIINKYDSTLLFTPEGKYQILFIENHDMQRFASATDNNPGKMRIGAAFNLLLKGVPSIYYGQEIGMKGNVGSFGMSDGNHIPIREAFEWYRTVEGKGMALWYKNSGPWWDQTNLKDNDGISLEEEKPDPASLWNFYTKLIKLRRSNPAISKGDFRFIDNSNDEVITFLRWDESQKILVAMNLSGENQEANLSVTDLPGKSTPKKFLFGTVSHDLSDFGQDRLELKVDPYGIRVWLLK
jgi:alpha-amylase